MAIKVPTYERQVEAPQQRTAQAQAPTPLRQAYGENVAQATGNLGNAIAKLGDDFIKIDAKNTKDKIMLATNRFDLEYKKFKSELQNRDDYQNFSADTDTFLNNQLDKMKSDFGDDLFNRWWNVEGKLISDSIKADTDIMKIPASIKQQNKLLQDNISTQSYNYATSEDNQDIIKESVKNQILTSNQTDFIKQGMLDDVDSKFAKADIDYWININPEKVKNNIKSGKYKNNDKSFLTAKEESDYLRLCDSRIKAMEGTIYDSKIQPLFEKFEELYAQSPSSANRYLEYLRENNGLQKEGIKDTKLINQFIDRMEKRIKEGSLANVSLQLTESNHLNFKNLEQNERKAKSDGDYVPIEEYLSFIDESNNLINRDEIIYSDRIKIQKDRDIAYNYLGNSIINENYNPTSNTSAGWFKSTNNGYLKNNLQDVFEDSGFLDEGNFKDITPQEVGVIYAQAYKFCNGMNMGESATENTKIKIQEAVSKSLIQFVSAKYGKSAKDSSDILIKSHILKLRNGVKNQTEGIVLNSYKD